MTNREGQFRGSSARNDVLALVKSTLGETVFQPRVIPPRIVAEIASMATLLGSPGPDGMGQSKTPRVHVRRPSIVAASSVTDPIDSKSSVRRTEPLIFACTKLSVYPSGLCSCAPAALSALPVVADRNSSSPPVAVIFCSSAAPSSCRPWAAIRKPPSGSLRFAPRRHRLPWIRAPLSRTVPFTGTPSPRVKVERSSALVRSRAVLPPAYREHPGPMYRLPSAASSYVCPVSEAAEQ